ncbi:MAG: peptidoglycan editing factor PgeF, partial [Rhodospirillales bacterium]
SLAQLGLQAGSLVTVHQVHGIDVEQVTAPRGAARSPRADALVTDRPGMALGILTADCAPLLLADRRAGVIGAAHAGWRGALAGVAEAAVAAMRRLGAAPQNIEAAIGPCIAKDSYEVGPEFPRPFLDRDPRDADFFSPSRREGRFMFDLPGYLERRLEALGLKSVAAMDCDTCADDARFFSYRRAVLRGEKDYGRNLSVIALEE